MRPDLTTPTPGAALLFESWQHLPDPPDGADERDEPMPVPDYLGQPVRVWQDCPVPGCDGSTIPTRGHETGSRGCPQPKPRWQQ